MRHITLILLITLFGCSRESEERKYDIVDRNRYFKWLEDTLKTIDTTNHAVYRDTSLVAIDTVYGVFYGGTGGEHIKMGALGVSPFIPRPRGMTDMNSQMMEMLDDVNERPCPGSTIYFRRRTYLFPSNDWLIRYVSTGIRYISVYDSTALTRKLYYVTQGSIDSMTLIRNGVRERWIYSKIGGYLLLRAKEVVQ